MIDRVGAIQALQQSVCREQGHLGVVGNLRLASAVELGMADTLAAVTSLDFRAAFELDRVAQRIAGGAAEQAPQDTLGMDVVGPAWPARSDVGLLQRRFDGTRAGHAHRTQRGVRCRAEFDGQARGDRPGSSETAAAVQQHAFARCELAAQYVARIGPAPLEALVRNLHVRDRKVMPVELEGLRDVPEVPDAKLVEFEALHERHHSRGTPIRDDPHVGRQIPFPMSAEVAPHPLARTQGHADDAGAARQFIDFERLRHGGLDVHSAGSVGLGSRLADLVACCPSVLPLVVVSGLCR